MCLSVVWSDLPELPCLDCHAHRLSEVMQIDTSQVRSFTSKKACLRRYARGSYANSHVSDARQ